MQPEHTPGPWRPLIGMTIGCDGHVVAKIACELAVFSDSPVRESELRANVSLIAAAPELLAACKQMVEDADWYSADTHDREAPHQLHGYELARSAIEKAEPRKENEQ